MGFKEDPEERAYREGYEEGYQAAMQELGMMGNRENTGRSYGQRGGQGGSYGQRDGFSQRDDYNMGERRYSRDGMGRFR